jgi:hypothetical protein
MLSCCTTVSASAGDFAEMLRDHLIFATLGDPTATGNCMGFQREVIPLRRDQPIASIARRDLIDMVEGHRQPERQGSRADRRFLDPS